MGRDKPLAKRPQAMPQAQWRNDFVEKVLHVDPRHADCLDWREADYHYRHGSTPAYAAACYLVAREIPADAEPD